MAASHRDHIQRDGAVERVPLEPGRAGPRLAADHELAAFGTLPVEPEAYQHFWTALEAAGQPPRIVASLDAGTSPKSGGAWPKTRRGARRARPCRARRAALAARPGALKVVRAITEAEGLASRATRRRSSR